MLEPAEFSAHWRSQPTSVTALSVHYQHQPVETIPRPCDSSWGLTRPKGYNIHHYIFLSQPRVRVCRLFLAGNSDCGITIMCFCYSAFERLLGLLPCSFFLPSMLFSCLLLSAPFIFLSSPWRLRGGAGSAASLNLLRFRALLNLYSSFFLSLPFRTEAFSVVSPSSQTTAYKRERGQTCVFFGLSRLWDHSL